MLDKTLKQHIQKIGDLKRQIDALSELYDTEKEYITNELKTRDTSKFKSSDYAVSLATFEQSRVDSKALKSKYPALIERYTKTYTQTRFTVKTI